MGNIISRSLLVVSGLAASSMAFAQDTALETAADNFLSDIMAGTATIGVVMISAAFGAIVWNWLKAAIFS